MQIILFHFFILCFSFVTASQLPYLRTLSSLCKLQNLSVLLLYGTVGSEPVVVQNTSPMGFKIGRMPSGTICPGVGISFSLGPVRNGWHISV